MQSTWLVERRMIAKTAIIVALAVAVYGVSFGAMAVTSGFSLAQTCAMSLFMFNGASQLAFVGVVGAGGSLLVAALSALLIGSRNATYGFRLAPLLSLKGARRGVAALFTVDESLALAMAHDRPDADPRASRFAFWSAGFAVYVLWNLASLMGALAASHIGDPRALGLDTAVAAGLAGLVWPSLRDGASRSVAAVAAVVALALTPWAPVGAPVILAGIFATALLIAIEARQRRQRQTQHALAA